MEHQKYIGKAIEEILYPRFEVTKQYLAVLEVEFEYGLPKVERVDLNFNDKIVSVYFPIKDEHFFLEIHLTKAPEIAVHFVWIQSGHETHFNAESDILTYEELSAILTFRPIEGWSKGDWKKNEKSKYTFSRISFKPIKSEAYELENQLRLLLSELEKDSESIIRLSEKATTYIAVCKHQYICANAGITVDIGLINRLSKLNLGIDIVTYIVGKPIEEADFE